MDGTALETCRCTSEVSHAHKASTSIATDEELPWSITTVLSKQLAQWSVPEVNRVAVSEKPMLITVIGTCIDACGRTNEETYNYRHGCMKWQGLKMLSDFDIAPVMLRRTNGKITMAKWKTMSVWRYTSMDANMNCVETHQRETSLRYLEQHTNSRCTSVLLEDHIVRKRNNEMHIEPCVCAFLLRPWQ